MKQIDEGELDTIGYAIKMSMDDKTLTLTLRADKFFTNRMAINALRDLADQMEDDCRTDSMDAPYST